MEIVTSPVDVQRIFEVVSADDFPTWNNHPLYGVFFRRLELHTVTPEQTIKPCSMVVVSAGVPVALVAATDNGREVGNFGRPASISFRAGLDGASRTEAFSAILDALSGATRLSVLGGWGDETPSSVDLACIDRQATPSLRIHAVDEPSGGQAHIRDSYRSLINWGQSQLSMAYVNADNQDRELFDFYPAFHARVAGSSRYGNAYWDVFWNEIVDGNGEVSLGYLQDGTLVSGLITIDAGATAYYTSGVYDRAHFDKPLAHFPVVDAIKRSTMRGVTCFDLGEIFPRNTGVSDKEFQIGFFKKGFASGFRLCTVWSLDL